MAATNFSCCCLPGMLNQGHAVGNNVLVFLVIQNGGLLPFGGAIFTGGIVTPATTSSWSYKNKMNAIVVNV